MWSLLGLWRLRSLRCVQPLCSGLWWLQSLRSVQSVQPLRGL